MRLSHLLLLSALFTALFGVGMMFAPDQILPLFGLGPGRAGVLVSRLLGAILLGIAVLNWSASSITDTTAHRAVAMGNMTASGLAFVVLLTAQGQGLLSHLGWPTITLVLLFTLGFAYYYLSMTGQR
ncbi:MAG: hypothetical protein RMN25_03450 [Anaerolineae bacterium]|nr:hypothetical protein [Thermoflexales bacterium]MDW8406815.1 hypothetical protein [Anaerolineae bacterium]